MCERERYGEKVVRLWHSKMIDVCLWECLFVYRIICSASSFYIYHVNYTNRERTSNETPYTYQNRFSITIGYIDTQCVDCVLYILSWVACFLTSVYTTLGHKIYSGIQARLYGNSFPLFKIQIAFEWLCGRCLAIVSWNRRLENLPEHQENKCFALSLPHTHSLFLNVCVMYQCDLQLLTCDSQCTHVNQI